MKHTPGPWRAGDILIADLETYGAICAYASWPCVSAGVGGHLTICTMDSEDFNREEQEANARLISAAPDLLAALESLLGSTLGRVGPSSIDPDDDIESMRDKCLAAINKATL